MKVVKKQTKPYKAGKYKGLSSNQAICSANGYSLTVSEIVDSDEVAVSFSSSHLCTVSSVEDGISLCGDVFAKFDKPDYPAMFLFCER